MELTGAWSELADAHDRYADIEVAYLLLRLERLFDADRFARRAIA